MQSPTDLHWQAVKWLLHYLKGTTSFGISFHYSLDLQLTAYANADWAGCPDDHRSTSGHCIFFGFNLVSWSSSKQKVVSCSSTEVEYKALANVASKLQWIQHLLQEVSISSSFSPILLCDNLSTTFLAAHLIFHSWVKHVELDCHFVTRLLMLLLIRAQLGILIKNIYKSYDLILA